MRYTMLWRIFLYICSVFVNKVSKKIGFRNFFYPTKITNFVCLNYAIAK
jgi:hypothetical protein